MTNRSYSSNERASIPLWAYTLTSHGVSHFSTRPLQYAKYTCWFLAEWWCLITKNEWKKLELVAVMPCLYLHILLWTENRTLLVSVLISQVATKTCVCFLKCLTLYVCCLIVLRQRDTGERKVVNYCERKLNNAVMHVYWCGFYVIVISVNQTKTQHMMHFLFFSVCSWFGAATVWRNQMRCEELADHLQTC